MRCPECGRYVGHENWCPDNPSSLNRNTNHVDNLFNNRFEDDDEPLTSFKRGNDYLDDLKPSGFEPEPYEPYKPLTPEIKPIKPFEEDRPSYLKSVLEPRKPLIDPLPRQEPLFKTPELRLPEPMTDKPLFPPPPTGIIRNYHTGIDTGIRFTDGGIIKNDLGYNIGKVNGNLIYNDSGHLMGKVAHDGRIMDSNGYFTGDLIDKHKL